MKHVGRLYSRVAMVTGLRWDGNTIVHVGGVGEHLVECVLCNSGQRDGVLVERVPVGRYCEG